MEKSKEIVFISKYKINQKMIENKYSNNKTGIIYNSI